MNLQSRVWFFTSELTMKKNRFMQMLNHSYREGGLTCGFNDYQLAEYIQQKRRKLPQSGGESWAPGRWVMGTGTWRLYQLQWVSNTIQPSESGCRDGVRHNSQSPWRFFPLLNIFSAWHIWLCIQPQNWHADYPISSTPSTLQNSKIIDGLSTTTHVFIRHDAVRKPILRIVLSHQKDW